MINNNTIKVINDEIDRGMTRFFFDRRSFKLVASSPGNVGSYYDVIVYDTIEVCFESRVTKEQVVEILRYNNE